MTYSVKTISSLTGIPRNTLLAWERRYAVVTPGRAANGYRMYSDSDLQTLTRVKALVDGGRAIREAVAAVNRDRLGGDGTGGIDGVREALIEALLAFSRVGADRCVTAGHGYSFEILLEQLFLPTMREVGDRWHAGTVTVAQEHFATAWCRDQMGYIFQRLGGGPSGGPPVLCAGLEGEMHELGLLAVAIRLCLRGHSVYYLGPSVPRDALVSTAEALSPELVCQSLVASRPDEEIVAGAQTLRDALPPTTRLALGGPAVAHLYDRSSPQLSFCRTFDDLLRAPAVR